MNFEDLRTPKFLKKEDCEPEFVATILDAKRVTTNFKGQEPEPALEILVEADTGKMFRYTLTGKNPNLEIIGDYFGWDTENLAGQKVKFWVDWETGNRQGAIRVSPVKKPTPTLKRKTQLPRTSDGEPAPADEIPFN